MTKQEREILSEFRKEVKYDVKQYILKRGYDIKGVLMTNEGLYLEGITADEICRSLLDSIDGVYLDIIKRDNMTDEEYEEDGGVLAVQTLSEGSDHYHKSEGSIPYDEA